MKRVKNPGVKTYPSLGDSTRVGRPRFYAVSEWLRRVGTYVEANYARDIAVDDLARVAGYSKFHFTREFRRHVGMSPLAFIHGVRYRRACALLTETDLPVNQVCIQVGIADPTTFGTIFKRKAGVTPTEYRRRHRAR